MTEVGGRSTVYSSRSTRWYASVVGNKTREFDDVMKWCTQKTAEVKDLSFGVSVIASRVNDHRWQRLKESLV